MAVQAACESNFSIIIDPIQYYALTIHNLIYAYSIAALYYGEKSRHNSF